MASDTKAALARIARLSDRCFGCATPLGWPGLIVMTDQERLGDAMAVLEKLPAGAALCMRDYTIPDRGEIAARLAKRSRERGIRFLVGADVHLAIAVNAWGVHMPEGLWRTRPLEIGLAKRRGLKVTTAVHSRVAAHRAVSGGLEFGCDAMIVSPVFPTASHRDAKALGPTGFELITRDIPVPAYALGGVNLNSIRWLRHTSAAGVAGISFAN